MSRRHSSYDAIAVFWSFSLNLLPAVLKAANEIAVAAFLANKIKFTDIPRIIQAVITQLPMIAAHDLATILHYDEAARKIARSILTEKVA